MVSEKDSSNGFLPKDVSDYGNTAKDITVDLESDFKLKEIKVTSVVKLIFLSFCLVGIGYSIITSNIAGFLIFCIVMVFIMDMMGMLDILKKAKRDMSKPGGYENIE
jgi:hypothetical protein